MIHPVFLLADAKLDIREIHAFITAHEGAARAGRTLDGLEALCHGLAELPERGNIPKEMAWLGVSEYRELRLDPYRLVYRVMDAKVLVYCVLDGRRDMRTLLHERLLR